MTGLGVFTASAPIQSHLFSQITILACHYHCLYYITFVYLACRKWISELSIFRLIFRHLHRNFIKHKNCLVHYRFVGSDWKAAADVRHKISISHFDIDECNVFLLIEIFSYNNDFSEEKAVLSIHSEWDIRYNHHHTFLKETKRIVWEFNRHWTLQSLVVMSYFPIFKAPTSTSIQWNQFWNLIWSLLKLFQPLMTKTIPFNCITLKSFAQIS